MTAIFFLNVVVIVLGVFFWMRTVTALRKIFLMGLLFKIVAGILLGFLYLQHYGGGDTWSYFHDGTIVAKLAVQNPVAYLDYLWSNTQSESLKFSFGDEEPRAVFFVKLVSLLCLATANNYWLSATYLSIFSFIGAWYFIRQIISFYPSATTAALFSFLLLPEPFFWSSGLLKEAVAMGVMYFICGYFLQVFYAKAPTFFESVLVLLAVWLLWMLKYFYAVILIPVLVATIVVKALDLMVKIKSFALELLVWFFVLAVPLIIVSFIVPVFYPENFLVIIVESNVALSVKSSPDDLISFTNLTPDLLSIALNSPLALVSGFFRPVIWETGNFLQSLVGIENLLLFGLFLMSLKSIPSLATSKHRMLILAMIVYTITLCIFITLATPNFGTLSRYRTGYLPFFCFLILLNNPVTLFLQRKLQPLVQ